MHRINQYTYSKYPNTLNIEMFTAFQNQTIYFEISIPEWVGHTFFVDFVGHLNNEF